MLRIKHPTWTLRTRSRRAQRHILLMRAPQSAREHLMCARTCVSCVRVHACVCASCASWNVTDQLPRNFATQTPGVYDPRRQFVSCIRDNFYFLLAAEISDGGSALRKRSFRARGRPRAGVLRRFPLFFTVAVLHTRDLANLHYDSYYENGLHLYGIYI